MKEKQPIGTLEIGHNLMDPKMHQQIYDRSHSGTIQQISSDIDVIGISIREQNPDMPVLEWYKTMEEVLPGRIDLQKQEEALAASKDPQTSRDGKKVFLFFNLKTIFSALEDHWTNNPSLDEELLQAAVFCVYERIPNISISDKTPAGTRIYSFVEHIETEKIPQDQSLSLTGPDEKIGHDNSVEYSILADLKEGVQEVLDYLPPKERVVLEMRFGIGDHDEHTQAEIGKEFGVTGARIQQLEARAIRKLRQRRFTKRFAETDFWDFPVKEVNIQKSVEEHIPSRIVKYGDIPLINLELTEETQRALKIHRVMTVSGLTRRHFGQKVQREVMHKLYNYLKKTVEQDEINSLWDSFPDY